MRYFLRNFATNIYILRIFKDSSNIPFSAIIPKYKVYPKNLQNEKKKK